MDASQAMYTGYVDCFIGRLKLVASDKGLRSMEFSKENKSSNKNEIIHYYIEQLKSYNSGNPIGKKHAFDFEGHSEFYQSVWNELIKIPFGTTLSYKTLSERIGNVKAIRAVAQANARNPIPIIIPCHRIIGSDGSLTGFSLGIEIKRKLLLHEKAIASDLFSNMI